MCKRGMYLSMPELAVASWNSKSNCAQEAVTVEDVLRFRAFNLNVILFR